MTRLKSMNITKIIGLGHHGYQNDVRLAQEVDGLDIVVGGHTHSYLYSGEFFILFIMHVLGTIHLT